MTLVSEIIYDAYRISNIQAIGTDPTVIQQTEALRYLNRILLSVFGNEAGDPLTSFPIGRKGIETPAGWPWWNDKPYPNWFVPKNTRLICNLENSTSVALHPRPDDGSRFAVVDAQNNFSTFPITIDGNGRRIDNQEDVVLDEDGFKGEWFYRDDLATWKKYFPLALSDDFPFGQEFDMFFVVQLALNINPANGVSIDEQANVVYKRAAKQLRARYKQDIPVRSELGLLRLSHMAADRDAYGYGYGVYNPNAVWDRGLPPW